MEKGAGPTPVGEGIQAYPGPVISTSGPMVSAADISLAYQQYYTSFCRLARLIVDDGARAEELVQDSFARTYAARGSIREPVALVAYLRRALVRACHSDLRRRNVERRIGIGRSATTWESDEASAVAATGNTADEAVMSVAVRRALAALSARQREALVLFYFADLDHKEVALAMGCSVGTVKSQLSKARVHMAALLDGVDGSRGVGEKGR